MTREIRLSERDCIFISYRGDDARGASGRLYDWLRIAFGRQRVFRDVHSIGIGKWRNKIDAALAQSVACVAVIGPRWANDENLARLRHADDIVRHELLTALDSVDLMMVPTLVEGAKVPDSTLLPPELHPLFETWNARSVSENRWEGDTRQLIGEIAEATSLPVGLDLDTLLSNAAAAQQRIAELEYTRKLQADQIEDLRRTIDELTSKLAEARFEERSNLAAAFAALAKGDPRAAEAEFEREYEIQGRAREESGRKRAHAARNVANLALLHDTAKAVIFYRKALELEVNNTETARLLSNALVTYGDLQGARIALSQSLRLALAQQNTFGELKAQADLGRVAQLLGNLDEASTALSKAAELAKQEFAADPNNIRLQRDLSVIHNRIGDLLKEQGNGSRALAEYRKGLVIRESLATRVPTNKEWRHDLSVSHIKVGEVLFAQGDPPGALAAYRNSLDIAEALAAQDPGDTRWQRDLSLGYNRIGDVLMMQGDLPGALAEYRKLLVIAEALAARDPDNTQWQRDISISYEKIGDVMAKQGDETAALVAQRRSHAIRRVLTTRNPSNTEWQRDLAVSHNRIGDVLAKQGDIPAALEEYRKGLAIREALATFDPANAQWQFELVGSCYKFAEHDPSAAERLNYLRRGHKILLGLRASGRLVPNLEPAIELFENLLASGLDALE